MRTLHPRSLDFFHPGSRIPGPGVKKNTRSLISDQQHWQAGVKTRDINASVNQSPCSVSLLLSKYCSILPVAAKVRVLSACCCQSQCFITAMVAIKVYILSSSGMQDHVLSASGSQSPCATWKWQPASDCQIQ
jgi:hypothetical protein